MQSTSSASSSIVSNPQLNSALSWIKARIGFIHYTSSIALRLKENSSLGESHFPLISLSQVLLGKLTDETKSFYANLKITDGKIESSLQRLETMIKTIAIASSTWEHSNSLLISLEKAIACLRKEENYVDEYQIRKFFTRLVYLNQASSPEEIRKAIELEQEHLDALFFFSKEPGTEQEKYDGHLQNCFELLAKLTGLKIKSRTLNKRLEEVLNHLSSCLSNKPAPSLADEILIRRSLAFFSSRQEWFFYQNFFRATSQLKQAKQIAENDQALQNQIELQSILLETNQAIRFAKGHKENLLALIKRIDALLSSSPSHAVIVLCARARICEFLAKDSNQPEKDIKKLLDSLNLAIKTGEKYKQTLDFQALQALSVCRFLFSFYSCFCFKTEQEYQEGHTALLKASEDFWVNKEMKQAIHLLNECFSSIETCPNPVPIKKENLAKLLCFKWMLLGEIEESYDKSFDEEIAKTLPENTHENESLIWDQCKAQFVPSFFKNKSESMQEVIGAYFAFHIRNAVKLVAKEYDSSGNRFILVDCTHAGQSGSTTKALDGKNTTMKEIRPNPQGDHNHQVLCLLNEEKLINLWMQSNVHRLIGPVLAKKESHTLQTMQTKVEINFFMGVGKDNTSIKMSDPISISNYSNVEWLTTIYECIRSRLIELQGNISYKTCISSTMQQFLSIFSIADNQIGYVLNRSFPTTRKIEKEILELRHHLPTLICCCFFAIEAYHRLEHSVANPSHKDNDAIFEQALQSLDCLFIISDSIKEKMEWMFKKIDFLKKRYHRIKETSSDPIQLENIEIQILSSQLLITTLFNDENLLEFREIILSKVAGKTLDEIKQALCPSQIGDEQNELSDRFLFIVLHKALHLIETQEVEAGMALLTMLLGKNNWDSKVIIKSGLMVEKDFLNIKKLRKGSYQKRNNLVLQESDFKNPLSPANPSANEDNWPQLDQSHLTQVGQSHLTQEIKKEAKEILQRQLEKKEKKQAKIASNSAPTTTAETTVSLPTSTSSTSVQAVRKEIPKTAMEIFNLLWQENAPLNGPWEIRSFRNDIKMTRKEALTLIEALGGSYFPERGKGSHHVAHIPKHIAHLPTIEFNGKDMGGIINLEGGEDEIMITLTSDKELKFYQVKQLRNILLKQGFNPDTVFQLKTGS